MAHWDAIVIGSGLGGLTCAAQLAREGLKVLVLEKLSNFGGAATVYRHAGLSIEASLHETDGDTLHAPTGPFHRLGLHALVDPIETGNFYAVHSALFAKPFVMPHGLAAARAQAQAAFPGAAEGIDRWFTALSQLRRTAHDLEEAGARGPQPLLAAFFSGRLFEVLGELNWTLAESFDRWLPGEDAAQAALAANIMYFDDDPAALSFVAFAAITARYVEDGSFYLRGGSASLVRGLLQVLKSAEGHAVHRASVQQIRLDGAGRACGVVWRDANGATHDDSTFAVIANAAPHIASSLLPPEKRADFDKPYGAFEPSISLFTIALGLSKPASEFGLQEYSTFIYPDWLKRFGDVRQGAEIFGDAPRGVLPPYCVCDYGRLQAGIDVSSPAQNLVTITGADRGWGWSGLDDDAYRTRKHQWIAAFVSDLDRRFPGLAGAITHREMATMRTMQERMGGRYGEVYGFRPTPKRLFAKPPSARTAIDGLWLASAYTVSGGYAGAMQGGLMAADSVRADLTRRMRTKG